ncbi:hypothetical protein KSC_031970 [Ktedonobacter sp. SOSP1-52]|nr:hypothetical protein KSC_031970 [Ktedonobacter sp. SOSP1-52]
MSLQITENGSIVASLAPGPVIETKDPRQQVKGSDGANVTRYHGWQNMQRIQPHGMQACHLRQKPTHAAASFGGWFAVSEPRLDLGMARANVWR